MGKEHAAATTEEVTGLRRSSAFCALEYANAIRRSRNTCIIYANISASVKGHARDWLVYALGGWSDRKVIAVVHNGDLVDRLENSSLGRTWRMLCRQVDLVVTVSPSLARRAERTVPDTDVVFVPNVIDAEIEFTRQRVKRAIRRRVRRKELRLVFVGCLMKPKGYADVLAAVGIARERDLPVSAVFVGRWASEAECSEAEAFVRRRGIGSRVKFVGEVSCRKVLRSILGNSDVMLLPSYYRHEAMPMSLVEGANAGLVLVGTDHGGIGDLVRDGVTGRLVPARDPEYLARTLELLAQDEKECERLSIGARAEYEEIWSRDNAAKQWMAIVKRYCCDRSSSTSAG